MSQPVIKVGISLRVTQASNYDEKRDALSHDWVSFSVKLDFLPIFIPNTLTNVKKFLLATKIDGLILSGGDNIGENPERDRTEKEIIDFGIESNLPIFGVCRGMQVLNKYFGGTLSVNNNSNHVGKPHDVQLTNQVFSDVLETNSLTVNSFHKNTITNKDLGADIEPFAITKNDSTIEGFIHRQYPILGVMWHPERDQNKENQLILKKILLNKAFWKK